MKGEASSRTGRRLAAGAFAVTLIALTVIAIRLESDPDLGAQPASTTCLGLGRLAESIMRARLSGVHEARAYDMARQVDAAFADDLAGMVTEIYNLPIDSTADTDITAAQTREFVERRCLGSS